MQKTESNREDDDWSEFESDWWREEVGLSELKKSVVRMSDKIYIRNGMLCAFFLFDESTKLQG